MKKEDKEKLITDLMYRYIESLDKYSTQGFYTTLGILGAFIAFLISIGLINSQGLNPNTPIIAFLFLTYILYINEQYSKYVDDLYKGLFLAIKENRLFNFKIESRKWPERYFFYKRKME